MTYDFTDDELTPEETTCTECRGSGTVRSEYGPVPCPDCGGKGTTEPEEES